MRAYRWVYVGFGLSLTVGVQAESAVELTLVGDWAVRVMVRGAQGQTAVIQVPPPTQCQVDAERYDALPVFDSRAPGWLKGVRLRGVRA
jgi:hypothetical protein